MLTMTMDLESRPQGTATEPRVRPRPPVIITTPKRRRRWLPWTLAFILVVAGGVGIAFLVMGEEAVEYTPEFQATLDAIAASYAGDLVDLRTAAPAITSWQGETEVFATVWPAGYGLDWVGYTYITDIDPGIWLDQEAARTALLQRLEVVAGSYRSDIED